jgi:hypothetical protein
LTKIVREEGLRNGLFKGMLSTVSREVPCYAGQFGGYYVTQHFISNLKGVELKDLTLFDQFISGGAGGFSCWLVSYPQDVIKTKLQVSKAGKYQKYLLSTGSKVYQVPDGGIVECAKQIYKRDGFSGFWRGFSACSARAIIANSFMFAAYEYAQAELNAA